MSDLLDMIDDLDEEIETEQEAKKKPDKKSDTSLKEATEKKALHPPKPPKPQKIQETISSKIDWIKLAKSSDFKRAVYLALEGKSFRGSNEKLDKELNKKITVFRDPNFNSAVKEMTNMFKNGFTRPSDIVKEQGKIENE